MKRIVGLFQPRIISERSKLYIFDAIRVLTLLLHPLYVLKFRTVKHAKLVLGSGPYYARKWINIEVNPAFKKDVWTDLRNPLPFRTDSVDFIYSAHVFEHLFIDEFHRILRECHRVLRPGGGGAAYLLTLS